MADARVYGFGPFEVDVDRLTLRREGVQLPARPKAILLLQQFLERPGEIIDKGDLFRALWPNVTVEENNLSVLMAALRKVLGDAPGGAQYITTVPGQGYRFTADVGIVGGDTDANRGERRLRALAVLPFTGLDLGDPPILSTDGLADGLIHRLSRRTSITLKPTWAVLRLGRAIADVGTIGVALEADLLLVGVVRRVGGLIRASAQLVDLACNSVLWSHQTDMMLTADLDIEAALIDDLIEPLVEILAGHDSAGASAEAADIACAHGRSLLDHRTEQSIEAAIASFEIALAERPGSVAALVGMADAYNLRTHYRFGFPTITSARAMRWARLAVRTDGRSAAAQASLGFSQYLAYDFEEADRSLRTAIQLDPGYAPGMHWYTRLLSASDQLDAAVRLSGRLAAAHGRSALLRHNFAHILFLARRFEAALEQSLAAQAMDPLHLQVALYLAIAASELGRHELAIATMERARKLCANGCQAAAYHGYVLARAGDRRAAVAIVDELANRLSYVPMEAHVLPRIGLGDEDGTLVWLARSLAERSAWSVHVGVSPLFDFVRHRAEFATLLQAAGLPLRLAAATV